MSRSGRNSIALRTMAAFLAAIVLVGSSAMTAERPMKAFAEGEQIQQTVNAVTLEGVSVTLSGDLGVNFYLDIEDDSAFDEAVVSGPQGKQSFTIADMETVTKDGKELRKFSYFVQPGQINQDITLSFSKGGTAVEFNTKYSESSVEKLTFTLGDYITKLKSSGNDTCLGTLVEALETYCLYAESYFNDAVSEPANVFVSSADADFLSKYKLTTVGDPVSVGYAGASLLLDSKTTFRLYFQKRPESAVIDGAEAAIGEKDGKYYIQLKDIAAEELTKVHSAEVDGCKFTFCALSYAYMVLNAEGIEPTDAKKHNLVRLLQALHSYSFAAEMYAKDLSGQSTLKAADLGLHETESGIWKFTYNNTEYTAKFTSDNGGNWHIGDDEHHSVEIINKADMQVICEALQKKHPVEGCITHFRTAHDMAQEWDLHNQAYYIVNSLTLLFLPDRDLMLKRLQDVDLDRKDQGKTMKEFVTEFLKDNNVSDSIIDQLIRGLNS